MLKNRLIILGSGTCFPAPKRTAERAHPGFLLEYVGNDERLHRVLIECSQGIASRLTAIDVAPTSINMMMISHAHPDHFALPHFVQTVFCHHLQDGKVSLNDESTWPHLQVIVPQRIAESMEMLNRIYFEETVEGGVGRGLQFPVLELITPRGPLRLPGGARLEAAAVYHGFGMVDALGFRVQLPNSKVFTYSGDSGQCESLIELAQRADLFLCEASSRIGHPENARRYGHLTPAQAGEIAKHARARRVVLTHYSGADSQPDMIRDARLSGFAGKIEIANDNQIFALD